VTIVNPREADVLAAAEKLYSELQSLGVEVLLDDRDERPGSKFKDADLIGIPLRLTVGARGLKENAVELQERAGGERRMLSLAEASSLIRDMVVAACGRQA
jgi:prolyl-tRNA synthetase